MVDTLRLALNAGDVRELTGWPDPMIEDYLQILNDLTQIIADLNRALSDINGLSDDTEAINGELQGLRSIVSLLKAKVSAAADSGGDSLTVDGSFLEPVSAFKVVQRGSGGYALASSEDPEANSRPVGITITAGTTASIQFAGRITNPEWSFTDGQRLFLGVDGELSSDPFNGVVTQQIGVAEGTNSIFLTPSVGVRRA